MILETPACVCTFPLKGFGKHAPAIDNDDDGAFMETRVVILSFLNCVLSFLHCVLSFLDCLRASVHRDEVIPIRFCVVTEELRALVLRAGHSR